MYQSQGVSDFIRAKKHAGEALSYMEQRQISTAEAHLTFESWMYNNHKYFSGYFEAKWGAVPHPSGITKAALREACPHAEGLF